MDLAGAARLLTNDHLTDLQAFLSRHADWSLYLRQNLLRSGLPGDERPGLAAYAGWWVHEELVGIVSHAGNNNLILQAPRHAGPLARWIANCTKRPLQGMCGPRQQLDAARLSLNRMEADTSLDTHEDLFALDLRRLRWPGELPNISVRAAWSQDTPLLAAWRADFLRDEMGDENTPIDHGDILAQTQRAHASGRAFVLESHGKPVAMCTYSARLSDCVQIGGVWTPAAERRRGYGRRVVAGALRAAHNAGIARGVLFTPRSNVPAQAAYRSLGFEVVGDYGLVQWTRPQPFGEKLP